MATQQQALNLVTLKYNELLVILVYLYRDIVQVVGNHDNLDKKVFFDAITFAIENDNAIFNQLTVSDLRNKNEVLGIVSDNFNFLYEFITFTDARAVNENNVLRSLLTKEMNERFEASLIEDKKTLNEAVKIAQKFDDFTLARTIELFGWINQNRRQIVGLIQVLTPNVLKQLFKVLKTGGFNLETGELDPVKLLRLMDKADLQDFVIDFLVYAFTGEDISSATPPPLPEPGETG